MKYFLVFMILIFCHSCQSQQKQKTGIICTRQHALDLLIQIPEVKNQERFIDSLTNHKHGLTMIDYDEGIDSSKPYYEINVGYSSDIRFEFFITFQVNKNNCNIWVEDTEKGLILLKDWSKKSAKTVAKIKRVSLPISINDISILDYPTPDKYTNYKINGTIPTSMLLLDDGIGILFFEGDKERWYLALLDENEIKNFFLIGMRESLKNGAGESYDRYIDISIDIDFNIKLEYSFGHGYKDRKINKVENYFINSDKKINKE